VRVVRWLGRFGLHLAAAVGATGVFVAAAAVGAHQYQQAGALANPPPLVRPQRAPRPADAPQAAPSPSAAPSPAPRTVPANQQERALSGVVRSVDEGELVLEGPAGRQWHVRPAAGALVRRNGKAAPLSDIQVSDRVVVLGVAQGRDAFMAHAITARGPK
jgi:hypothetical protein